MHLIATHYDVLGVERDASLETIRAAYRTLARQFHPDTSARGSDEMATVNEAYRVLADPGRRAVYDRSLADPRVGSAVGSARGGEAPASDGVVAPVAERPTFLSPSGPARVPWKLMAVLAVVGSGAVIASSTLGRTDGEGGPDGIIRPGSCVEFEPNGDAREVTCAGDGDLVVEVMVPLDGTCPAGTMAHRDRLGMGIACVLA